MRMSHIYRTILLFFASWISTCDIAHAQDWTQWQGNPAHTGYVPGRYNPAAFTPIWSVLGNSQGAVIDEERVYIKGEVTFWLSMREQYSYFRAYDRESGSQLWERKFYHTSYSGFSAPSLSDGRVLLHQYGQSASATPEKPALIGLDSSTG